MALLSPCCHPSAVPCGREWRVHQGSSFSLKRGRDTSCPLLPKARERPLTQKGRAFCFSLPLGRGFVCLMLLILVLLLFGSSKRHPGERSLYPGPEGEMGCILPSHNPLTGFGFATEWLCKWLCWSTSLVPSLIPSPTFLQHQGSGFFPPPSHSLQSSCWELSSN